MLTTITGGLHSGHTQSMFRKMQGQQHNIFITNDSAVLSAQMEMAKQHIQGACVGLSELAEFLATETGMSYKLLPKQEQLMLISKIIIDGKMLDLKVSREDNGVFIDVLNTINSFKSLSITPADLEKHQEDIYFDDINKLKDLIYVYSQFNQYLAQTETVTKEDLLVNVMRYGSIYNELSANIYVDILDDYPYALRELLWWGASSSKLNVYIALLGIRDKANYNDIYAYTASFMISDYIENVLQNKNSVIKAEFTNNNECKKKQGLKVIQDCFFNKNNLDETHSLDGVHLRYASNVHTELLKVAQSIQKNISSEGYSPSEIVVTGNIEPYLPQLNIVFKSQNIPFTTSNRKALKESAVYGFLKNVCDIAKEGKFTGTNIVKIAQMPFLRLSPADIASVTCFFTRFGDDFDVACGNSARFRSKEQSVVIPIVLRMFNQLNPLVNSIREDTINTCLKQLIQCFDTIGIPNYYHGKACELRQCGDIIGSQIIEKTWDTISEVIRNINDIYGEVTSSPELFMRLVNLVFDNTYVNQNAMLKNSVIVCDLAKARGMEKKILYVIGCSEGSFPPKRKESLFTNASRHALNMLLEKDIKTDEDTSRIDLGNVYLTLISSAERTYISWAETDSDGKTTSMASSLNNTASIFKCEQVTAQNDDERFYTLIGNLAKYKYSGIKSNTLDLDFASFKNSDYAYRLREAVENIVKDLGTFDASKTSIIGSYKGLKTFAVTQLENFARCPFKHFVDYGLRPKKVKRFEETPLDVGNLYHEVLAQYVLKIKDAEINNISQIECETTVEAIVQAVISTHNENVLGAPIKEYDKRVLTDAIKRAAWIVVQQIQSGKYKPQIIEKKVEIPISDNSFSATLSGKIDRADVWNDKVRIIDYKTGSVRFDSNLVKTGLQLQLPLYASTFGNDNISGIYYESVRKSTIDKDASNDELSLYKLSGPTRADRTILTANDISLAEDPSKSNVISVDITQKGQISARSDVIDNFDDLINAATEAALDITQQICSGVTEAKPYRYKGKNACTYCEYKTLCHFDSHKDSFREIDT